MSNLSLLLLLQLRIKTKTELKKQMKKISITLLLCLLCLTGMAQGQKALDLKDITSGRFRPENIQGVIPMPDGEHYTQMNDDGTQIIKYSFKTGEKVEVIFDVKTARECDFKHFDSYQFSPDGKKLLIATKTTPIYRHSYTAVHYIYPLKRNDKGVTTNNIIERLSDGGPQQVPVFSPDGTMIAFVRDNNICFMAIVKARLPKTVNRTLLSTASRTGCMKKNSVLTVRWNSVPIIRKSLTSVLTNQQYRPILFRYLPDKHPTLML